MRRSMSRFGDGPFLGAGESLLNIIVASSELSGWAQDCAIKSTMGTVAPRGYTGFFVSSSSSRS